MKHLTCLLAALALLTASGCGKGEQATQATAPQAAAEQPAASPAHEASKEPPKQEAPKPDLGVPIYPGATETGSFQAQSKEAKAGTWTYETPDSYQKVVAFYKEQIKNPSFTQEVTLSEDKKATQIHVGDGQNGLAVTISEGDAKTTFAIVKGENK